jgi:hypothetical protein
MCGQQVSKIPFECSRDINILMNFMTEHDTRLKKRAPCFFSLCLPSITQEYKLSVFYHTTNRKKDNFGLRMLIVCEEANSKLMDSFETSFKKLLEFVLLQNLIDRFQNFEEAMFSYSSK